MKRIISLVVVVLMMICLPACGNETMQETSDGGNVDGGWTEAESNALTEEQLEIFNKAMDGIEGAEYTPVAYVASQVVSGTNHLFLVKALPTVPDAVETYSLVSIYEDLEGNSQINDIINSDAETGLYGMMGSWEENEDLVVTDDVMDAFNKANETITGAELTPVLVTSHQIVSGTNYHILCESVPSVKELVTGLDYSMITLYVSLDGNAEITEISEFAKE